MKVLKKSELWFIWFRKTGYQ